MILGPEKAEFRFLAYGIAVAGILGLMFYLLEPDYVPDAQGSADARDSRARALAEPEFVTSRCRQSSPDTPEAPEMGSVLQLAKPEECDLYRASIPQGDLLTAPGTYLVLNESFNNQQGKDEASRLQMVSEARSILTRAGWRETDIWPDPQGYNDKFRAEFSRTQPDQTRQFFFLFADRVLKLKMVSLPKPRVNLSLPDAWALRSEAPVASKDSFPELPPLPGLAYQKFERSVSHRPESSPGQEGIPEPYSWYPGKWIRTYRSDPARIHPAAAVYLYRDALRNAGWHLQHDYDFDVMTLREHVSARLPGTARELVASVEFDATNAYISLEDIGLQRQVAALVRHWQRHCVGPVAGLDFEPGGLAFTETTESALHVLLDALRAQGTFLNGRQPPVEKFPVEIRGRAAPTGNPQASLELGLARAKQVREWLVERGVAPERLAISSHGEWETEDPAGRKPGDSITVARVGCLPVSD